MTRPYPHYVRRAKFALMRVYETQPNDTVFYTRDPMAAATTAEPGLIGGAMVYHNGIAYMVTFKPVMRLMADVSPTPCAACEGERVTYDTGLFWSEAAPCAACTPATLTPLQQAI